MDLFHDTGCSCAYCELDREERSSGRRSLVWAGALTAALLIALGAWLAPWLSL
jgi:ferric-dicitrate binding protein FerR (iron transport regulator)